MCSSNSAAQYRIPLSQYSLTVARFGSPTQAIPTINGSTMRSTAPQVCASLSSTTQSESGSLYVPYQWDSILPGDLDHSIFSFAFDQTEVLSDWQSPDAPWMEISSPAASNHQDLSDNAFRLHQDLPPTSKSSRQERYDQITGAIRLTTDSATHSGQVLNELSAANMAYSYSLAEFDWEETNQVVLSGESSPLTQSSTDVNSPVSTNEETRHKRKVAGDGGRQKCVPFNERQ